MEYPKISGCLVAVGALLLGIVVGYVSWFFFVRFKSVGVQDLVEAVGVLCGGAAVTFLAKQMKAGGVGFACYAIGVFIGSVIYFVVYALQGGNGRGNLVPCFCP